MGRKIHPVASFSTCPFLLPLWHPPRCRQMPHHLRHSPAHRQASRTRSWDSLSDLMPSQPLPRACGSPRIRSRTGSRPWYQTSIACIHCIPSCRARSGSKGFPLNPDIRRYSIPLRSRPPCSTDRPTLPRRSVLLFRRLRESLRLYNPAFENLLYSMPIF